MSVFLILAAVAILAGLVMAFGEYIKDTYMTLDDFFACWLISTIIMGAIMGCSGWAYSCYQKSAAKERLSAAIEQVLDAEGGGEETPSVEESPSPNKAADEVRKFDFGTNLDFGNSQIEIGDFGGEKE